MYVLKTVPRLAGGDAQSSTRAAPPRRLATAWGAATFGGDRGPRGGPRRSRAAALALGNAVERARLLHLLARADRIAFLQELGEGGADALCDRILHPWAGRRRWRCGGRLEVAQQIVGQAARARLQRSIASITAERRTDCMTSDAALALEVSCFERRGGLTALCSLSRARVTRQFHKMHGLGNDFVIVDAREAAGRR